MAEDKSLIRSTRVIGSATLLSRILGFIRDVIIAGLFGTGMRAQAFVVAFRIPNLLRNLVGEASSNATVVPVLSRLKALGEEEEFWQVANPLFNILLILLAGLTLLGELFAPYIVRAIAPGFIISPEKLELTIRLTRLMFPYILLIGLAAYAMAVLNSLQHFALPALAPCMLNISLIASALLLSPRLKEPVVALAIGVLAGGLLQLIIQFPLLISKGLFKKRFGLGKFFHPKIKEIGRLLLPRTLGIAVYQINLFVDTIFASLVFIVGEGAPAALQYANRLVQFPLALFGISLAQAALPALSGLVARNDFAQLKKTISFSLRSIFTMMVPATVGIMVLAYPLVKVIFERGQFDSFSTEITSFALCFYCLGLTGYAGIKIVASYFYSINDTITPGKVAGIALLVNILLNLILMWPLKIAGLALATAVSVTINFLVLLFILRKKMGGLESCISTLVKATFAACIMGGLLWLIFYRTDFLISSKLLLTLKLGISIIAGILVYFLALSVFAKEEAAILRGWMLRKK